MAEQKFRLPGSSYEELQKIIVAYNHYTGKATNSDISKRAALHPTIVSRNAGFLVECGIIEPGQKKQITDIGSSLAQAVEHKIEEEVQMAWRNIFEDVGFFDTVLSAIRIRSGMDASTLKSHIAYTAGQKKSKFVMTGAQTVIDILKAAGYLAEDDGRIVVDDKEISSLLPKSDGDEVPVEPTVGAQMPTYSIPTRTANVTIQVQIQVTSDELDHLGEKLRAILDELAAAPDADVD